MDSLFSLFDPTDGNSNKPSKTKQRPEQDNVKKKSDPPRGRRRGRKLQDKSEMLSEESSFLCEPELSTDLLVKDGSYIESYIEMNTPDEDVRIDADKKARRRNSGRKSRRKKSKISPAEEDSSPCVPSWCQSTDIIDNTTWNNRSAIEKCCDDSVGKNVNDLRNIDDSGCVSDVNRTCAMKGKHVYNVIDKLERVNIEAEDGDDDMAGEFDEVDLENDLFHSDEDGEEPCGDTTSDPDDSGDEVYGNLPPEPRFGNVEYKLQLVSPCERRFQHLVTQLKWRLRSGGGAAVYVLGVRDCGSVCGLRARALRASLSTLRRMARVLHAVVAHLSARRVAPHRAVAEVYIRKMADTQQSVELRVAVMGANEAGKSTLIGVLTQGELDNGRGSARLNMFRHLHEVKSGNTSSLSHEILGFDAQGNVVNYGCSELMTAERIGERSAKLVSFLDLAGHSKYQRTTLHGLTGYCPHYTMLVISATAGITPITEEHIGLLTALDLPFFAVINKSELAPSGIGPLLDTLAELLASTNKKPLLITDENMARECVAPQKLILNTIDKQQQKEDTVEQNTEHENDRVVAVFPVSCVRGLGLSALHAYLLALQPPQTSPAHSHDQEACEFQIDEIFRVGDSAGPVVGGLLTRGQLFEGDNLIIGPLDTGEFVEISVKTIYRNRVPCGTVKAGSSASLGLSHDPPNLRPGMVLLSIPDGYKLNLKNRPKFGACPPGSCKGNKLKDLIQMKESVKSENKHRKDVRRINKNLFHDIEKLESRLAKTTDNVEGSNVYRPESDEDIDKGEFAKDSMCVCDDHVYLEDPSDPRGCLFFQAWVEVLGHATAIACGFQCTVHVGNVRQTAIIEGILSRNNELRVGSSGSVVFRFARYPEYLLRGRQVLLTAGQGTRAIGRVTQIFPFIP